MINLEQARDLLQRAVETQGREFVYNPGGIDTCLYEPITERYAGIKADDPRRLTGCLIGVALDLAGETRHHGVQDPVHFVQRKYPDMMTPAAAEYFRTAQFEQDSGNSWGEAYDHAESRLDSIWASLGTE